MPNRKSQHTSRLGFSTRAIWTGQDECPATGATIPPVYQSVTYTLPHVGVTRGFDYSRTVNPTRTAMERQLAALEGGTYGTAFSSGMAAVAGAASVLRNGDHLLATRDIYGGTHRLFTQVLSRYGIEVTFVDTTETSTVWSAAKSNTRMLWLETPSNPTLKLCDIAAIAAAKPAGVIVACDNTFASPYLQQPLQLGADIVVHSTTKYIGGHSDVVGGVAITNDRELGRQIAFHQNAVGAVPGPWDAYLILRGAKTLAVRMEAHCRNAEALAEFLAKCDDVAQVYYPGLPVHPQHQLAKRQMQAFGGIVTFRPKGGVARAYAIAAATRVFSLAVSLGGVESLLCSPAKMTHASLTAQERAALGIGDDLIRLSVGIEDTQDLIDDLASALERTAGAHSVVPSPYRRESA